MVDIQSFTNHFHTEPVLIEQENCKTTLKVGQLVYVDSNDGKYKPALAVSLKKSTVQGMVWSFIDNNKFYLKTSPGPIQYRFPLNSTWMYNSNELVIEDVVLFNKIPTNIGKPIYLSDTVPGAMSGTRPEILNYAVLIGYKTSFGLNFKVEPYIVCYSLSQALGAMRMNWTNPIYPISQGSLYGSAAPTSPSIIPTSATYLVPGSDQSHIITVRVRSNAERHGRIGGTVIQNTEFVKTGGTNVLNSNFDRYRLIHYDNFNYVTTTYFLNAHLNTDDNSMRQWTETFTLNTHSGDMLEFALNSNDARTRSRQLPLPPEIGISNLNPPHIIYRATSHDDVGDSLSDVALSGAGLPYFPYGTNSAGFDATGPNEYYESAMQVELILIELLA